MTSRHDSMTNNNFGAYTQKQKKIQHVPRINIKHLTYHIMTCEHYKQLSNYQPKLQFSQWKVAMISDISQWPDASEHCISEWLDASKQSISEWPDVSGHCISEWPDASDQSEQWDQLAIQK